MTASFFIANEIGPGTVSLLMPWKTILLILLAASFEAVAQAAESKLSFEAAAIKVVPPPEAGRGFSSRRQGGPGTQDPGLYTCTNCTFAMLVQQAFDLPDYLVAGVDSIGDHLYDVSARVPAGSAKEQFLLMFQDLLIERFKLATHREMRELPAYELSVGKSGPKLKKAASPKPGSSTISFDQGKTTVHAEGETMDRLARLISNTLRAPVVDSTLLRDGYDFDLTWDGATSTRSGLSTPLDGDFSETQPTIFGALQSQLGLKLEGKKARFSILVVDHFEKIPTAN